MKKLIIIGLFSIATVLLGSCTGDFLDVNDNPNSPTESTPGLTLAAAEQTLASLNGTSMNYLGNYFVYNWTVPSNWSANQALLEYRVTSNFYSNIFETSYGTLFKNLTYVKNFEDPDGQVDYSAYDAIAETIKGFQYQYLVDLYGDVPYTEANQRAQNLTPAYDDAETVYKSTIDSLTAAASLALNLPDNAVTPGNQDFIFGGDMQRWAQFANTIKLRMLIRLSNTGQEDYINEQISLIEDNGAGFITDNVTANPGYNDNADKQNPFYGYAGFQAGTNGQTSVDRYRFTRATDYAIDYLQDETNDPRLTRLYAPSDADGIYIGAPQDVDLPATGFTTSDLSAIGPGLLKSSDQDSPIMLLSEALLLQAEAVQRGYINGDAQALYEGAISASFDFLGVEDQNGGDAAADYYSQDIENVSWSASPDKIEAIITQKWVALNGISGIESWIEFTRTGFPEDLPTSESATESNRPVRLLYPTTEYSNNSNNVPQLTPQDAFTMNPFWDN